MASVASRSEPVEPQLPALDAVPAPRAARRLAMILLVLFLALPVLLASVPWVQNVGGTGRVSALEPIDRTQVIPAPVTGRLARLHVREGSRVEQGDLLAEMEDQDPQYAARLQQQFEFARNKAQAAKDQVDFYDDQLGFLELAREQAIASARFELNGAIEKVRAEEQALEAAEAELEQKFADRERKWTLYTQDLGSELKYQEAQADWLSARAKVEAAKAKVEQARNDEQAKMASMNKIGSEQQAKIESTKSSREEARAKVALAEKDVTEALTKVERQKTQVVNAPRSGFILRVHGANRADLMKQGDPLIELIPDAGSLAVELWVSGNDAPLIEPGRKVRLQFEGWPAVQFACWPSVAVGTFGGEVLVVDAQGGADGRVRLLIVPDPDDAPWPGPPYLRQGVRATGWVLLESVSLGYEIWRQLNAFPPTIRGGPGGDGDMAGTGAKGGGSGGKGKP